MTLKDVQDAVQEANDVLIPLGYTARYIDGKKDKTVKADVAVLIEGQLCSGVRTSFADAIKWLSNEIERLAGEEESEP